MIWPPLPGKSLVVVRICVLGGFVVLGRLAYAGTSGGSSLYASIASVRSEPGMAAGDGI